MNFKYVPFIIVFTLVNVFNLYGGVFPENDWEIASPESQNTDSEKLEDAMVHLKRICGNDGIKQTLVIRNGYIIWQGDEIDKVHNVYSCTKTFTSTVLGLLIDDGKCGLETFAKDYIQSLSKHYNKLTLKHFATLTSGYESFSKKSPFAPNFPLFEPGTKFHYGDASMNQFANVLTRIAGEPIGDLFKRRIADPIGMNPKGWRWGDFGIVDGILVNGGSGSQSQGMHISAREFARFGLLFLNRGNWDGRQLISVKWVQEATSSQVDTTIQPYNERAWYTSLIGAYGFNWWTNGFRRDGQRRWPAAPPKTAAAQGNYNNYCFIFPEWQMVIVRLGADRRINNELYKHFFEKIKLAIKK
jgi:CubicO group peptidase (beta-lactamase class C family)